MDDDFVKQLKGLKEEMLEGAEANVSRPFKEDPISIYCKNFCVASETHGLSDELVNAYLTRRPFQEIKMLHDSGAMSSDEIALLADLDAATAKRVSQDFREFCSISGFTNITDVTIASILTEITT